MILLLLKNFMLIKGAVPNQWDKLTANWLTRILGSVLFVALLPILGAAPLSAAAVGRHRLLLLAVHVGLQLFGPLQVLHTFCSERLTFHTKVCWSQMSDTDLSMDFFQNHNSKEYKISMVFSWLPDGLLCFVALRLVLDSVQEVLDSVLVPLGRQKFSEISFY